MHKPQGCKPVKALEKLQARWLTATSIFTTTNASKENRSGAANAAPLLLKLNIPAQGFLCCLHNLGQFIN